MKKIPTLFERNYETDRLVRNEVTPGCEWVLAGEGAATEKVDGTCCLVQDEKLYKRYELKKGKAMPDGFKAAQEADPVTGDIPGWVPVGDGPEDRWHREALAWGAAHPADGTYELVGPHVQGNTLNLRSHVLLLHATLPQLPDAPRDFEGLREFMLAHQIEGIVWHHPDGRMAKLKRTDFGFAWGNKKARA